MESRDVVILGLNISGLGILQSLGERGVSLLGIDRCRTEIGFYSSYGEKVVCRDDALIDYLVRLGKNSEKKRLLLPTSDDYLLVLSRAEASLNQYYYLPFPSNALVEQILNKYKFYLLASQFTDDIPECTLLTDESHISWQRWPAIVKPIFIHEFRKFYPNEKAWVVHNQQELSEKYDELSKINVQAIVQEIIPGQDSEQYSVCVYLDKKSKVKQSMVAQKIRQNPPGYGVGTYVEMIEDEELLSQTSQLLKKIGCVGIAEVEYRRDERDNKLKLIEINSRVWSQNKLASYGGADIVGAAYFDLLNVELEPLPAVSKRWVFFVRDFFTCLQYLKKNEIDFSYIKSTYLLFFRNIGAVWSRKDIKPTLFMPVFLYNKILSNKNRK